MPSPLDRRTGRSAGWALLTCIALASCSHPESPPETDPVVAPPAAPDVADSLAAEPAPAIRVLISEEEHERLVAQATHDLEIAQATSARRPDLSTLTPEERQRWETLDHYVELAESFLAEGDARSASDLALKARLLAADLDPD